MRGSIRNPNHKPATPAAALTVADRNQIKAAVQAAIKGWPAEDEDISVHRLTAAVRAGLGAKVDPAKYDGSHIEAVLRELGY